MRHKINIVFEQLSLQKFAIKSIIRTCINAVLDAEGINVPCEINVLVTDDAGIRVVNRESRHMDKPTDVLSFPMFQLIAGEPPTDWTDFQDPETGLVPLGICAFLWNGQLPRPKSSAIPPAGRWGISPSTPCFICWAMTIWTRARKRRKCAAGRKPLPRPSPI